MIFLFFIAMLSLKRSMYTYFTVFKKKNPHLLQFYVKFVCLNTNLTRFAITFLIYCFLFFLLVTFVVGYSVFFIFLKIFSFLFYGFIFLFQFGCKKMRVRLLNNKNFVVLYVWILFSSNFFFFTLLFLCT